MATATFTNSSGNSVTIDGSTVDCVYPLAGPANRCKILCSDGAEVDVVSTLAAALSALDVVAVSLPRAPGSGTAAAGATCAIVRGCALRFGAGPTATSCAVTLRGGAIVTVGANVATTSAALEGVGTSGGTVEIVASFFGDGLGGAPVQAPAGIVTPGAYTPASGVYDYTYNGTIPTGVQLLVWASSPSDDVIIQTARVIGSAITVKLTDGAGAPVDRLHVVFVAAVRLP